MVKVFVYTFIFYNHNFMLITFKTYVLNLIMKNQLLILNAIPERSEGKTPLPVCLKPAPEVIKLAEL